MGTALLEQPAPRHHGGESAMRVHATTLSPVVTKRCIRCLIVKPLAAFSPARRSPQGVRADCRDCRRTDPPRAYRTTPGFAVCPPCGAPVPCDDRRIWKYCSAACLLAEHPAPPAAFVNKLKVQPNGCQLWMGPRDHSDYGKFTFGGRKWFVHRLAYLWAGGTIPEGWHIDHLCRTPPCGNAEHLEAVTPAENTRRGFAARRSGRE